MKTKFLETGKIVGTHGVRGEIRVQPWCDSPAFLCGFRTLYLDGGAAALEVLSARTHGNVVLMKLRGVDSIEAAERYRGKVLYLDRADADLPEGDYFIQDLIGCRVIDADTEESLGTLSDVSQTGANDVWHVTRDGQEYLVPAIPDVVVGVDIEAERILLRPMKGIFDDAD